METIKYLNLDCVLLENNALRLLVTQTVGPRVISFGYKDEENLFAELPDEVSQLPDGKAFHFYGGHRLWDSPESMPTTYTPDDFPVDIVLTAEGLSATQHALTETGLEKTIYISVSADTPQVVVVHQLTNRGSQMVECAPWAITQLKPGGVAILPQSQSHTGLLPNRTISLWPYSDVTSALLSWGNRYILAWADKKTGAFKLGFPNPRVAGWHIGSREHCL